MFNKLLRVISTIAHDLLGVFKFLYTLYYLICKIPLP